MALTIAMRPTEICQSSQTAGHQEPARGLIRKRCDPHRIDSAERATTLGSGMADVDLVTMLNAARGGFEVAKGLTFTRITPDEVEGEVPVGPHLVQPYGLVHGGVYSSIVETLASVGAAVFAMSKGQTTVGL